MTHAKRLWSIWQALLSAFAWAFTRPRGGLRGHGGDCGVRPSFKLT